MKVKFAIKLIDSILDKYGEYISVKDVIFNLNLFVNRRKNFQFKG